MLAYIARRLVHMIPVLFLITLFIFILVRLVPGDPASSMLGDRATAERVAALNRSLKLDEPYYEQYVAFMNNLLHGDLGDSIRRREPVVDIILQRVQPTLFLSVYTMVLATLISVPLSTIAALKKGRSGDQAIRIFVILSLGLPTYFVGMMLLQFSGREAPYLPRLRLGRRLLRSPGVALPAVAGTGALALLAHDPQPAQRTHRNTSRPITCALPGPRDWECTEYSSGTCCAIRAFQRSPSSALTLPS